MMAQYGLDRAALAAIVQTLGALVAALAVLLVARRLLFRYLYRRAPDPRSLGRVALDMVRVPSMLWCLAAALAVALRTQEMPERYAERTGNAILTFVIISLSMVGAAVSVRMLRLYGERRGIALAASGMARTLIHVAVYLVGATILLRVYQANVTPLLATLGVGGLAVALALQDTLANFFAGIHILIEEPISVGHSIRLSENEEGVVTDIGWRTTRVRTGKNTVIVVPNTKITSGILINYSLPDPRMGVDVSVLVAHEADPDLVERCALEEVRATPGVLAEPPPRAIFAPGMLPTHLQFTVVFNVAEYQGHGLVQSEARLRILRRLKAEGVPLPRVEIR